MRFVRVTWNDAQDHLEPWVDEKDAESFGDADCLIISVGILVKQTPKYLTLAADWNGSNKDYGRVTKIPLGMVQSVEDLLTRPDTPQS